VSFLSPLFLAGALTAGVPLILHLLKREPEPRIKFAAVKLLKTAPVELTEKRRLREILLLALRVAALVLLALAFARPFFASGAARGADRVTIIAIDTSYSFSAPGRMERVRELATDALARVPGGERVGVVTFSDVADVVARPSADRAFASAAIDGVNAGYGATRYRVGLNAAAQALGGARGTIVVITDLQESGWDVGDRASVPESAQIEIVDAGPPPPDLAITSVRVAGDRIVATVRNTDTRARDTRGHFFVDGRAAGDAPLSIPPNASAEVAFAARGGGVAEITIDDPNGWQADNVRYLALGAASRPTVVTVTATGDSARDAFYVHHALASGGAYQVVGVSGAQLGTSAAVAASPAAIVVLSTRGLERRGREALATYVRGGGGLLIAAGPDIDGEVIADVAGGAPLRIVMPGDAKPSLRTLAPADVRHPVFQPFGANAATLGLVRFQTVARVGGDDCQTLARFTSGEPALLDCGSGDGRAMVIASDLNNRWNDFPLHPTFVAFLHEAVRYLSSARPHESEYLVGDAPAGVPRTPGIVSVTDAGNLGRQRRVAVNVDPRETDPGRLTSADFQAAVTRLKDVGASEARVHASEQEDRQHLWQYALGLMLVALAFEGIVASRTA
jgi:hypothetical protein